MKSLITTAALSLLMATTAVAADQKISDKQDMMKDCHSMMKDGKMMDNMPKDMMTKCHGMMDKVQGNDKQPTAKSDDDTEHSKHHPKQ